MEHFWRKTILTAAGVLASAALGWMVIYPYVIVPQIGVSDFNTMQLLSLMLVGLIVTFIVLGSTVRSAREFWIMSAVSGFLIKAAETVMALAVPYAPQTPFTAPLEHWTIGLLFSILFTAFFILIGLPFGWLFRSFRKPDLQ
jgi:hypothetical protein